jgi:hypothetical protein
MGAGEDGQLRRGVADGPSNTGETVRPFHPYIV